MAIESKSLMIGTAFAWAVVSAMVMWSQCAARLGRVTSGPRFNSVR